MIDPEDLKSGKVTILTQEQILNCPHVIMMPEHYQDTGGWPCNCHNPNDPYMKEWGYIWKTQHTEPPASGLWVSPDEEDEA